MPEPLSIATATLQVATIAAKLGKNVYSLVKGIKNAPANINVFVHDLQGLYLVLGSLQFVVGQEASKDEHDHITEVMLENLEDLLGNTVQVLKDAQIIVGEISRAIDKQGIWTGFKWETGKRDQVLAVQVNLQSYKLTLNLACSALTTVAASATRDISTSVLAEVRQLRRQLDPADQTMLAHQKEVFEQNLESSAVPRLAYSIPLLRYLEETETVLSSSPRTSRALSMSDLRSWSESGPEVYKTTSRASMDKRPEASDAKANTGIRYRKPVGGLTQALTSNPSHHIPDSNVSSSDGFTLLQAASKPIPFRKEDISLAPQPPIMRNRLNFTKFVDLRSLEGPMPPPDYRAGLDRSNALSSEGGISISAPFNFEHVTHINHERFMDINELDDERFAATFQLIMGTANAALAKRRRPASARI